VIFHHPLVLANIELVVLRDVAVVLQCFLTIGLLMSGRKRDIAYLEQLRRGEKTMFAG